MSRARLTGRNLARRAGLLGLLLLAPVFAKAETAAAPDTAAKPMYGIALRDTLKYPADFTHFDYVNPDAPKGGELRQAGLGTFDTLNPFTLKGVAAEGAGMVFETLMGSSLDEPFSQYGWVAQSVTVAPDRSWVSYKLRPEAKFHDGNTITPEDVIFSYEILRDKGTPFYRSYYKDITSVEKTSADSVKFSFKDKTNAELPLIMGQLVVLEKKTWDGKDFAATTLDPIMGSGPYEIDQASLVPGRSISYKRVKDWWAKDLPLNRGRYNFDTLRYDYYRDSTVALEAFLGGRYDYRFENIAKNWALAYNTPAVQQGLIKKEVLKNELPAGMQAFIFNLRRPMFQDPRVREALGYAFDFEWSNKNFAYGSYQRTQSYFENSELAAKGTPSADELKILEPYRGKIPDAVFTQEYKLPTTDASGNNRDNLRKAAELLKQAGWTLNGGTLVDKDGKPFAFEIIENEPVFERWISPMLGNLKQLGIQATLRVVDTAQFQNRLNTFDYDMTVNVFGQSLSPGNEQYDFWSSSKADLPGSRNLIGIKNPVVDSLIDKLVQADSRAELLTITHALDRVLLWNYYVIPNWHLGAYRIAYWDKFGQPAVAPKYGLEVVDGWWVDPAKAQKITHTGQ